MENQSQEQQQNGNNAIPFLAGMVLGGLAGTAVMLSMAPQSGEKARTQIQHRGIELRDQATETVCVQSNDNAAEQEQCIHLIMLPRCPLLDIGGFSKVR